MTGVVPGTLRCERVFDRGTVPPYVAGCACGWFHQGQPSHRAEKHAWHRHLRAVRASLRVAA